MSVLVAILAFVVLLPFIALGLCVGAVLLFGRPKKAKPAPARNVSGPPPAAAKPAPTYIRRWSNARRAWEINELERFQQELDR